GLGPERGRSLRHLLAVGGDLRGGLGRQALPGPELDRDRQPPAPGGAAAALRRLRRHPARLLGDAWVRDGPRSRAAAGKRPGPALTAVGVTGGGRFERPPPDARGARADELAAEGAAPALASPPQTGWWPSITTMSPQE